MRVRHEVAQIQKTAIVQQQRSDLLHVFQSLEASGSGRIRRGRPYRLGSGCGTTIREWCDLARTDEPLTITLHDHIFVLADSTNRDLIVRADANRLPVGPVAGLVVFQYLNVRVADDVIESRRSRSFGLGFITRPLQTGDDLSDLLSPFTPVPSHVELSIRCKYARIQVRIQCVERRRVTHDQRLYVQLVLNGLRSSDGCNHDHEQDENDYSKSPHSSSHAWITWQASSFLSGELQGRKTCYP